MAYGYPNYMQQQQYPGYGQPMQQPMMQQPPQQVQPNMICRPVAGDEEARSVPTDFSGAITIMPDFAHGKIFTKALNQYDGTSVLDTYIKQQPAPPVEYAPIGVVQSLAAEIEQLKQALAEKTVKQTKGSADK